MVWFGYRSTNVMDVLTGGVDEVPDESSSFASRLKCSRTSLRNSFGYSKRTLAFSIINETIWAKVDALVVRSSADICRDRNWHFRVHSSAQFFKVSLILFRIFDCLLTFLGQRIWGAIIVPKLRAFILLDSALSATLWRSWRSWCSISAFSLGKRRTSIWRPRICLCGWFHSAKK